MGEQLLNSPKIFDIIISDFGREAAVKYVRSMAAHEREIIYARLKTSRHKFYDEYRKIMFVLVGDIAYYKESMIEKYKDKKYLDSGILIGIGKLEIPHEVKKRIIRCVMEQVYLAVTRGYNNIRIIIPCNTLSQLLEGDLRKVISDTESLYKSIVKELCLDEQKAHIYSRLKNTFFRVCTVQSIILEEIRRYHGTQKKILILGTSSSVKNYRTKIAKMKILWNFNILGLSASEQNLINNTVVAAVDEDKNTLKKLKQRIATEIIKPRQHKFDDLLVVEACTDFDLGLGLNTREIFVRRLVNDVYEPE